jgi:thiopurine S-methyltransferase
MNAFDASFWSDKYKNNSTGWDVGHASTPLKTYIEQLGNKEISILIPGCGNSYEAELLHHLGFTNGFVLDIAKEPLENFSKRVPHFPKDHLLHTNFFNLEQQFDLILEQTFFCALHPSQRLQYVQKMHQLLYKKGRLAGLLFDFPLTEEGPPFGGNKEEYVQIFSPYFTIKTMAPAYNSIESRRGRELFVIFEKSYL